MLKLACIHCPPFKHVIELHGFWLGNEGLWVGFNVWVKQFGPENPIGQKHVAVDVVIWIQRPLL